MKVVDVATCLLFAVAVMVEIAGGYKLVKSEDIHPDATRLVRRKRGFLFSNKEYICKCINCIYCCSCLTDCSPFYYYFVVVCCLLFVVSVNSVASC